MPRTRLAVLLCGVSLAGCLYQKEPAPRIMEGTGGLQVEVVPLASVSLPEKPTRVEPVVSDVPRAWMPPGGRERRWTAVVIHHSATATGNADIFDRWHREGNHWDGVGYDFVIGNGSDSADGCVEVTFRWTQQRTGAHCGGTPGNWANEEAVGICLVGDFSQRGPTPAQMRALTKLVRFLQQRYGIPTSRVYGHGDTPGSRVTECPGRAFPMTRLKAALER